jgi:hypothetical protein
MLDSMTRPIEGSYVESAGGFFYALAESCGTYAPRGRLERDRAPLLTLPSSVF